jgi:hypothetical protein
MLRPVKADGREVFLGDEVAYRGRTLTSLGYTRKGMLLTDGKRNRLVAFDRLGMELKEDVK